jgi:hypothetical protein
MVRLLEKTRKEGYPSEKWGFETAEREAIFRGGLKSFMQNL